MGQPRTPTSGDNLGVLDYHLEQVKQECDILTVCDSKTHAYQNACPCLANL